MTRLEKESYLPDRELIAQAEKIGEAVGFFGAVARDIERKPFCYTSDQRAAAPENIAAARTANNQVSESFRGRNSITQLRGLWAEFRGVYEGAKTTFIIIRNEGRIPPEL